MKKGIKIWMFLLTLTLFFGPVFLTSQCNSSFESAGSIGKATVEVRTGISFKWNGTVEEHNDLKKQLGKFKHVYNGTRIGIGISDRIELHAQYQANDRYLNFKHLSTELGLTLGAKFALLPEYISFSILAGVWFPEMKDFSLKNSSFIMAPKLIFSFVQGVHLEQNFATQINILVKNQIQMLSGFFYGITYRNKKGKVAVRPEAGLMINSPDNHSLKAGYMKPDLRFSFNISISWKLK